MAKEAKQTIFRTGYVSDIDQFLKDFEKNRTQVPASRQKECAKYKKIYDKRDGIVQEEINPIWKDF